MNTSFFCKFDKQNRFSYKQNFRLTKMKYSQEINQYITGEKFSAGMQIPFSLHKYEALSRIEKIVEITKNKNIIHIGCADHLALIEKKIAENKWLHKLLLDNSKKCIGFDINKEAVDFIKNKIGIEDVYALDVCKDEIVLDDKIEWDYVILGELIEHVPNPVDFLQKIKSVFDGKVKKILITAPNVCNLRTYKSVKSNIELINTDHYYWFSPYTLARVVNASGYENCEFTFSDPVKLSSFGEGMRLLKKRLKIKNNLNANRFSSIILTADF